MDWRQATQRLSCVLLLTAAAFPLAAITPAPTAKTCEAVMQWAKDNRPDLPRDYRGLQDFPADQRRAIYSHLTAEEKAAFWSGKVDAFLAEHADLDAAQVAAVNQAKAVLTPELYVAVESPAAPTKALAEEQLALLAQRVTGSLGEKMAKELLYGLGPVIAGKDGGKAGVSFTCDCYFLPDCQNETFCDFSIPCSPTIRGCGVGGSRPCEGICNFF